MTARRTPSAGSASTAGTSPRRRPGAGWWIGRLAVAMAVGLVAALVLDVVRAGGVQPWFAAHRLSPPYLGGGRTVDVAGRPVYLDCRGSGAPTVILDSGLGTGAGGWGFVPDEVATFTRVCLWDRPGIGRSAGTGRHTATETVAILREALAVAGERPPFVAVGHSLGGVYVRVFAARQSAEMAGIVLVDPYLPDIRPARVVDLPPGLVERDRRDNDDTGRTIEATEDLDWAATLDELVASRPDGVPVELLFVEQRYRWEGEFEPFEPELIATWKDLLTDEWPQHRLTIAVNSTHMIQIDRPSLVVEAIRRVVDAAAAEES